MELIVLWTVTVLGMHRAIPPLGAVSAQRAGTARGVYTVCLSFELTSSH